MYQMSLEEAHSLIAEAKEKNALGLSLKDINEIPEEVYELKQLKSLIIWLDVDGTEIKEISPKIAQLKNLEYLELRLNYQAKLPDELFDLKKLSILSLAECGIKELSPKIGELNNLEQLVLDNNYLENLPEELGNLSELKVLTIEKNLLVDLPQSLEKLTKLETLYITQNLLESLPTYITRLPKLESLGIASNRLKEFPYELNNLKSLNTLFFDFNPFLDVPGIADIHLGDDSQLKLFKLLSKYIYPKTNQKHFTLLIEESLKIPLTQYLLFFKEYVAKIKNKKIYFEIEEKPEGLTLVTNGNIEQTELIHYLKEYVEVARENLDTWIPEFTADISPQEADIFRIKLENHVSHFKNSLRIALLENKFLKIENKRFEDENTFLRELTLTLANKENQLLLTQNPIQSTTANQLAGDELIYAIVDKSVRMMERKSQKQIEDLHNALLVDWLRDKGYQIADQTRSGKSQKGSGELDIMIRKENGTPISIIEAFRLKSCGEKDRVISTHLDKLLHDYDTSGHSQNFVIVYAETKNFLDTWEKYISYINDLENKPDFRNEYPLLNFRDKSKTYTNKTDIKVGLAKHDRHGEVVEVFHIFLNMAI